MNISRVHMTFFVMSIFFGVSFSLHDAAAQPPSKPCKVIRGQIYCDPSPAPRKSVPCNDPEIQVDYDKQSKSYHHYGPFETKLCSSSTSCNQASVFSKMTSQARFITPTESSLPVSDCMIINVHILPVGRDDVRVSVDEKNFSATNYTRKNHALYPGKVSRTIVEKDGAIYVVTEGEGTGNFKDLNESKAPGVWLPVDKQLRAAVQQR
jgi:hypothetical protein